MISYHPVQYKDLVGQFKATIAEVEVASNNFPDDGKSKNYCEELLNISFQLTDPETLETIVHTQKFVAPLTGGKSLFQQLLNALDELPDAEGGAFDESKFIGLDLVVTMGKNKKGYATVDSVEKRTATGKEPVATAEESVDTPF